MFTATRKSNNVVPSSTRETTISAPVFRGSGYDVDIVQRHTVSFTAPDGFTCTCDNAECVAIMRVGVEFRASRNELAVLATWEESDYDSFAADRFARAVLLACELDVPPTDLPLLAAALPNFDKSGLKSVITRLNASIDLHWDWYGSTPAWSLLLDNEWANRM